MGRDLVVFTFQIGSFSKIKISGFSEIFLNFIIEKIFLELSDSMHLVNNVKHLENQGF